MIKSVTNDITVNKIKFSESFILVEKFVPESIPLLALLPSVR